MNDRSLRLLGWGLSGLVLAVIATYLVAAANRGILQDSGPFWILLPAIPAASAMLIIRSRPRHSIGWLLMVWAVSTVLSGAADLPLASMAEAPDEVTFWLLLALWFHGSSWILFIFPIFHLLQVFPTGRILTPRWRWLVALEVGMASLFLILAGLSERFGPGEGDLWTVANPIGFLTQDFWEERFAFPWTVALVVLTVGAATSSVIRYRRSQGVERQQLKWLVFAVVFFALAYSSLAFLSDFEETPFVSDVIFGLSIAAIPVSIAVAVLRYRLYDIDVVISRTLVYGALALFITGVYVSIVVGVGKLSGFICWLEVGCGPQGSQPNIALSLAATALVAIAFQPVRRRLQQVANRLVYGRRATPYQVLSDFSRRLSATDQNLIDQAAHSLADGTSAQQAAVWVKNGDHYEQSRVWPDQDQTPPPVPLTVEQIPAADLTSWITHNGERLGALTLTFNRGHLPTPIDQRLISELAAGMGLALRNSLLTENLRHRVEELRDSRRRIVEIQDRTRRQLERDLHDGAQQLLVALKVKLSLARRLATQSGAAQTSQILDGLTTEADSAIQAMRDLARSFYPPLLEAEGLPAAVTALARKAPLPISVDTTGIDRYPQPIEATIYFCLVEALNNLIKHSRARSAHLSVRHQDDLLTFTISDDGTGFDPTTRGNGLTNIADRLDAAGGNLNITSTPSHGTTLTGTIPVDAEVPAR
jgi:signal transduction histidine kinase